MVVRVCAVPRARSIVFYQMLLLRRQSAGGGANAAEARHPKALGFLRILCLVRCPHSFNLPQSLYSACSLACPSAPLAR